MGAEQLAVLLEETIATALREKQTTRRELRQVTVDTTVQEKNITHPTDSKLYHTVIISRVEATKARSIRLRQTYVRVSKNVAGPSPP